MGNNNGNQGKQRESRDVVRVGNREGIDGWQEEEVVAKRRDKAGEQRRKQAEAHRYADNGRQEHKINIFDPDPVIDQFRSAQCERDCQCREQVRAQLQKPPSLPSCEGSSLE